MDATNSSSLTAQQAIDYIMYFMLPVGYSAQPGAYDQEYRISDPSGKLAVRVRFACGDCAGFVYYLDENGPFTAQTGEQVVSAIGQYINEIVSAWCRGSFLRKEKLRRLSEKDRLLPHLENHQPMAYISPDLPALTDPEAIKLRRLQLWQAMEFSLRVYGFGYHAAQLGNQAGFVLYGNPGKDQLLKQLVVAYGRKFGQQTVGFCHRLWHAVS